jgi:hypothetical protein
MIFRLPRLRPCVYVTVMVSGRHADAFICGSLLPFLVSLMPACHLRQIVLPLGAAEPLWQTAALRLSLFGQFGLKLRSRGGR